MDSDPRNWKWMVPGGGMFGLLGFAVWVNQFSAGYGTQVFICQGVLVGISLLLLLQTIGMYSAYYRRLASDDLMTRQRALSVTAQSTMLEAAKGVHPAVIDQLFRDRARRWGLVSGTRSKDNSPYSVLQARPRVTDKFVVHFLKMSNEKTYMPKNMLAEGNKSWDPSGIVEAREMYDDLESLLLEELKVTRPYGWNKPGYWLAGWGPESVAADLGLDLEDWNYDKVDVGETVRTVAAGGRDLVKEAMADLIPLNGAMQKK